MSNDPKKDPGGKALIEDGYIVIRIQIDALPIIVEGAVSLGNLDPMKITDAAAFAKDLVETLNNEDEQGTTLIHEMFDEAIGEAADQGAQGWEEMPDEAGDEDDG